MGALGWILVLAFVGLVATGALVVLLPWLRRASDARRDYHAARGTQHKQQLEGALARIEPVIAGHEERLRQLEASLLGVDRQEAFALDRALADHLINTALDDVPGLGAARVGAIRAQLFSGDLQSLHRAETLPGIGSQTQQAISIWVNQIEREWQDHLARDFTGKAATVERFTALRIDLAAQRDGVRSTIADLRDLERQGRAELARLRSVTPAAFRRGRGGTLDTEQSSALQAYLLGVFPPWGQPPAWFGRLLEVSRKET